MSASCSLATTWDFEIFDSELMLGNKFAFGTTIHRMRLGRHNLGLQFATLELTEQLGYTYGNTPVPAMHVAVEESVFAGLARERFLKTEWKRLGHKPKACAFSYPR